MLKVTRGRKLRVDSTVVETVIHHPSDSSLLGAGVRVLSRLLRRARVVRDGAAAGRGRTVFRTRTRSVRRLAQRLHRLARRKGTAAAEERRRASARVIRVARTSRGPAVVVCAALRARSGASARRLVRPVEAVLPRVERAIAQATRRVLKGEAVPAPEKIVSLVEPHTPIIGRHKAGRPVAFGRKLWLEEVEGGIVSGWRVLAGAGQDAPYLAAGLAAHQQRFGKPPRLLTADRGVFSPRTEAQAERAGVRRVAIPAAGRASGMPERTRKERQGWFRRGFRFRAGIEGRISVLRRCYGLDRCRAHGERGLGRWVGWGIVTANLERIARTVAAREPPQAA
jgi:IS5 family transposase